jgi:hypothetical protein
MENLLSLYVKEAMSDLATINQDLKKVKYISPEKREHIEELIEDIQWKNELAELILRRR